MLETNAVAERRMQLFMRSMTEGVPSERDRLLHYTVGEFYYEMSLFIEECDKRQAAIDKMKTDK